MVWRGTLHHRPENSPNTKVRQTLYDGKWELQRTEQPWRPHQQLQTGIFLFSCIYDSLSLYPSLFYLLTPMNLTYFLFSLLVFCVNCSVLKWRVLHSWIFRSISAHGTSPWRICQQADSWRLRNAPKYTIDQTLLSEQNTRDQLQFCYQRKILVW